MTVWLIEWPESVTNPVRWWNPVHGWMRDANAALQFARKTDADCYLSTMRIGESLKVTEHTFVSHPEVHGPARSDGKTIGEFYGDPRLQCSAASELAKDIAAERERLAGRITPSVWRLMDRAIALLNEPQAAQVMIDFTSPRAIWHQDLQTAKADNANLRAALDLAVNIIMAGEPGDSRAVSDEAVALAAVACGDTSAPVMKVVRAALALTRPEGK